MNSDLNPKSAISSDEVNYLVFRYLMESGFVHAQFAMQQEAGVYRVDVGQSSVKPGALVSLLQKGLQYLEVETHATEDENTPRCIAPFSLIGKHECELVGDPDRPPKKKGFQPQSKKASTEKLKKPRRISDFHAPTPTFVPSTPTQNGDDMDIHYEPKTALFQLNGHSGDVYVGKWSSQIDKLAVGSADGVARLWTVTELDNDLEYSNVPLSHKDDPVVGEREYGVEHDNEVLCLDWNPSGETIATGSYSGIAKIWTKEGDLKFSLTKHQNTISCLSWNASGDTLITGSEDNTAIAWDGKTGEMRQQFDFHFAPIMDIAWKDETTFTSGSADKTIYVCQLGSPVPLRQFVGHESDVNTIRWDSTGTYLASSSDDNTAKIWTMESHTSKYNLTEHDKVVFTLQWFQSLHAKAPILITGSHDFKIKFWDPLSGSCLMTFDRHTDAIYAIAISPDHKHFASGSSDKSVMVWSAEDGKLVETFKVPDKIYHLDFNKDGSKIAVCGLNDHLTIILPFKK